MNKNYLQQSSRNPPEREQEERTEDDEIDPVAYAEFISTNVWEDISRDKFTIMINLEAYEMKNLIDVRKEDLNGHIVKLKKKSENIFAVADSGSPMSFLNEKTANRLQTNDISARFKYIPLKDAARRLACYNEKCIIRKRLSKTAIESVGWTIKSAPFIIVDDQKANIIRRNIMPKSGIALVQEIPKHD